MSRVLIMTHKKHPFGIYIHWPYCLNKCPYCDFASKVSPLIDETLILNGYKRDISVFKEKFLHLPEVTSIFFGGGTPSLMTERMFDEVISLLYKNFSISPKAEVSLEANPDAIDLKKMKSFKESGLNRLSIGVQSLNDKDLKFLGRIHSVQTALKRIEEAKSTFKRINIDLIYARPYQKLKDWENELLRALNLGLNHYSLYQLTLEEGTPFYKNNTPQISDLQARRLYQLTDEIMQAHNLPAYEISNYAKIKEECRHNLLYWNGDNYLGIGPASHGRMDLIATENQKSVYKWLQNAPQFIILTEEEKKEERLLMGLRLVQKGYPTTHIKESAIKKALSKKWINIQNNKIYTTLKGRLMLNQLILLLSA